MAMVEPIKTIGKCICGTYSYLEGAAGSTKLRSLSNLMLKNKSNVVIDLETTGLDPYYSEILLFSFTFDGKHAYLFNPNMVDITPFLEVMRRCPIINHNIKFDYKFIKLKYGIEFNIEWDTQIVHSLALAGVPTNPTQGPTYTGGNSLKNLAKRYLGITLDKDVREEYLSGTWRNDRSIAYAADDVLATWALVPVTDTILEASGMRHLWEEIEKPLIQVLAEMELEGIRVNLDSILNLRDSYQEKLDTIEEEIRNLTKKTVRLQKVKKSRKKDVPDELIEWDEEISVNPGSSKQLIDYFMAQGIEVPNKQRKPTKTRREIAFTPSVDGDSLSKINHPIAKKVDTFREYQKALSSFLIPWSTSIEDDPKGKYNPKTQGIHGNYKQTETTTARISMSDPNLMQVPKESSFRHVFIAPDDCTLAISDLSQYELRVLAQLSRDPAMIDIFTKREEIRKSYLLELEKEDLDEFESDFSKYPTIKKLKEKLESYDMHSRTAISVFKLDESTIDYNSEEWKKARSGAKAINFGIPLILAAV